MALLEINIPCYNEEATLPSLIAALRQQTFSDFSVIFHDNGSTDGTADICRDAVATDPRFTLNQIPLNTNAFQQAKRFRFGCKAEYVAFRSANDLLANTYFEEALNILQSNEAVGLVYNHGLIVDDDGNVIDEAPLDFAFDTRGLGRLDGAIQVMSRYTYSFALWGVYRRSVLEKCSSHSFPYGGDHIWVCEMALYGDIANSPGRLDLRREDTQPQKLASGIPTDSTYYAITQSEEMLRGVPENSFFESQVHRLPFTNMLWGHLEMFSLALIPEVEKVMLCKAAGEIFDARFGMFIDREIAGFIQRQSAVLEIQEKEPREFPRESMLFWVGKVRREIDKIRLTRRGDLSHLDGLDNRLRAFARKVNGA